MDLLLPDDPARIGPYRLLGRLGAGGMGRVYLARSEGGRTVAVKLVLPELAQDPEFRRRFTQEVAVARRVGGDWTAPVLDADTTATTPWVATGYVPGPSLEEVVRRDHGPLPESSVRALGGGLVRALGAIHSAGLVHRDLKPSNVLVTIDGPRVIDFGIARALDTVATGLATRSGVVVGSPGFMSPEQVRGERVTPAGDVFCLGAVLAYAATGRLPFGTTEMGFHALMWRIVEEPPDTTGLPEGLTELVEDCLRKDPHVRPSVEELVERLPHLPSGAWLPGEVLVQLGRRAADLLHAESPAPADTAPAASCTLMVPDKAAAVADLATVTAEPAAPEPPLAPTAIAPTPPDTHHDPFPDVPPPARYEDPFPDVPPPEHTVAEQSRMPQHTRTRIWTWFWLLTWLVITASCISRLK